MKYEIEPGMIFNSFTVKEKVSYNRWLVNCKCGNPLEIVSCKLVKNIIKSCGCLKSEVLRKRNTTHGLSKIPEYQNWKDMFKRCFNKNNKRYNDYASRGISVHPDFRDFTKWLKEIGTKPNAFQKWSVGRIDNNQSYTYGNIRWELDDQQARNHTLQRNNTSGFAGVKLSKKTIAGKEYTAWVACWKSLDGKSYTKNFSADKFGFDKSKQMAIDFRNDKIAELNSLGADYAASHGSAKNE